MSTTANAARGPSLFLSHGTGPFPLLDPAQESLRELLRKHGNKFDGIKAIIMFSAHWETDEPHIGSSDDPGVYYDYEDQRDILPKEAFEFQYSAPGNSKLAAEIAEHLGGCGFQPVLDPKRGLDHSVYVPMTLMRPKADIPIVQMSVLRGKNEAESTERNIKLGEAMEHFRDKGYAIVGSGGSYHDFETIAKAFFGGHDVPANAIDFEAFLESVASISDPIARREKLLGWRDLPESYISHLLDKSEHFMPFMVASGCGGEAAGFKFDTYQFRGAPMSFYQW